MPQMLVNLAQHAVRHQDVSGGGFSTFPSLRALEGTLPELLLDFRLLKRCL